MRECMCSKVNSEPWRTPKMDFAKIMNDWKALNIFAKRSILDVWQDSEYTSGAF